MTAASMYNDARRSGARQFYPVQRLLLPLIAPVGGVPHQGLVRSELVSLAASICWNPGNPELSREHNLLSESLWERAIHSLTDSPGSEH